MGAGEEEREREREEQHSFAAVYGQSVIRSHQR